ncbi:MAG: hypothetical protein AB8B85_10685 [Paracoccaceae bacterium]
MSFENEVRDGLEALTPRHWPVEGMTYQRAQMLNFEGAPLAQLAFLDDVGAGRVLHHSG